MAYRGKKQQYDVPMDIPAFNPIESPMQQRVREGVGIYEPTWGPRFGAAIGLSAFTFNEIGLIIKGLREYQDQKWAKRKKVGRQTYGSKDYVGQKRRRATKKKSTTWNY